MPGLTYRRSLTIAPPTEVSTAILSVSRVVRSIVPDIFSYSTQKDFYILNSSSFFNCFYITQECFRETKFWKV